MAIIYWEHIHKVDMKHHPCGKDVVAHKTSSRHVITEESMLSNLLSNKYKYEITVMVIEFPRRGNAQSTPTLGETVRR